MKKRKYKPVVYTTNSFSRGAQDKTKQVVLLKAMQITQDPKELRKMIGVKTVADVYRTLDKLAMRKEYHEALARSGITFDYIIDGMKRIADSGEKDGDRLKALQTMLKSLGLEKYDSADSPAGGSWEEELIRTLEREKEAGGGLLTSGVEQEEYDVNEPELPESVKKLREDEEDLTDSVYD
jgi:hypothetical protein